MTTSKSLVTEVGDGGRGEIESSLSAVVVTAVGCVPSSQVCDGLSDSIDKWISILPKEKLQIGELSSRDCLQIKEIPSTHHKDETNIDQESISSNRNMKTCPHHSTKNKTKN